jgi:hypothetical protein
VVCGRAGAARVPVTLLPSAAASAFHAAWARRRGLGVGGGRIGGTARVAVVQGKQVPVYNSGGGGGGLDRGIGDAGQRRRRMGQQAAEAQPLLLQGDQVDAEWGCRPHRIVLFVEPSPFASVLSLLVVLLVRSSY